jgi:excisionase family DNA binding protein
MRELMDKRELVEYTNGKLRPDTVGRLTREGKIPVVRFPGIRRYFFDKTAIDAWLDSCLKNEDRGQEYGKIN